MRDVLSIFNTGHVPIIFENKKKVKSAFSSYVCIASRFEISQLSYTYQMAMK